ncbi:MAG: transporter substrate-binding domain-containing protein, partial [Clostridia bacterium]|nr:transporter substrate-binding domain-containing protein [Clostridia bacterium]
MRKGMLACFTIMLAVLWGLFCPAEAHALQRYLKVAFNPNLPPFQFLDVSGMPAGMHVEMLDSLAKERGFILEYLPYNTNRECLDALSRGKADIVLGQVAGTADKTLYADTDSLTTSPLCLLVRDSDLLSPQGVRIAVFASDTGRNTLLSNLDFSAYIVVGNQRAVFERQMEEPGLAMIGVKDSLLYQLQEAGLLNDYTIVRNYLDSMNFSLVVNAGDRDLLRTLNRGIALLKSSPEYETIHNHWVVMDDGERARLALRRLAIGGGIGAIAALFYFLMSVRVRRLLQKRVDEQTTQIQAANRELEKQLVQIQNESNLRNRLIKYSPSGMLLCDAHYAITLINKRALAITGLERIAEGTVAMDLPVFGEILREAGASIFAEGVTIENQLIRLGQSPDALRTYRYTVHQEIFYGKVSGILLTVQDITEEESARQAAFQEEKSLALIRIAAGIAHEIRNPLMSIRTFATLIGAKGDDKQVQESFARYVPTEVDRINKLIESLIHYTKPVKGVISGVRLSDVADECLYLARPLMDKQHTRLMQALDDSLWITADRDQLKQVLLNLLMNGIEAMHQRVRLQPEGSPFTLLLRTAAREDMAIITVRDEGVGMSAERLRQCRDPFYTTKERGTGLGLALCDQYVKETGGTMQ